MAVILDTPEKIDMAVEFLDDPSATPEELAQVEAALQKVDRTIDLATSDVFDSDSFFRLPEDQQKLGMELRNRRNQQNAATGAIQPMAIAGGMGKAVGQTVEAATALGAKIFLPGDLGTLAGQDIAEKAMKHSASIDDAVKNIQDARFRKAFGRAPSEEEQAELIDTARANSTAGGVLQDLATTVALPFTKGATFWGTMAKGTGTGAAAAYFTADAEGDTAADRFDERLGQAKFGAIVGGALGSVAGIYASVRNQIASAASKMTTAPGPGQKVVQQFAPDGSAMPVVSDAQKNLALFDEFGMRRSLGQVTGNPVVQTVESQAGSKWQQAFIKEQTESVAPAIAAKLKLAIPSLEKAGAELPGKYQAALQHIDDVRGYLTRDGAKAWKKSVERAFERAPNDAVVMPAASLKQLRMVMQDNYETLARNKGVVKPNTNLRTLFEEVDKAFVSGKGATVAQMDDWWVRMNAMKTDPRTFMVKGAKEGSVSMMETLAGKQLHAFKQAMTDAPDNSALNVLRQGRDVWHKKQMQATELREQILKPMGFGKNISPESALHALDNTNVSTMKALAQNIRKQPNGATKLREINEAFFEGAVKEGLKSGVTRAGQAGSFDIQAFQKALASTSSRARQAGLLSPEQEKNAAKAVRLVKMILNESAEKVAGGVVQHRIVTGLENISINLVSRSPEFMARLLAGAVARGKGADWLFFSDEGVKLLTTIAPKAVNVGARGRNAAAAVLAGIYSDGITNEIEAAANAQMEQQQ